MGHFKGADARGINLFSAPVALLLAAVLLFPARGASGFLLVAGLGDSLTQGTMDGTDNALNTRHAYLQRVADALREVVPVVFSQPLLDLQGRRIAPFRIPTNLGVDGSDVFSAAGIEYFKRVGAPFSYLSRHNLCTPLMPWALDNLYDKVLYPLNLHAGHPVSQVDSALWVLNHRAPPAQEGGTLFIHWIGNNDSSLAALGLGGSRPGFMPIPLEAIREEISPELRALLTLGEELGLVSFAPYTMEAIQRNLTEPEDFARQYGAVLEHLMTESPPEISLDLLVLTLPYYNSVGYLMDSEDLEFYLKKCEPDYSVPPTFKRVSEPGEPITNPLKGDRISLLTFGFMYMLLATGHDVEEVNLILEKDGQQQDGLVLSQEEARHIMDRTDTFNEAIREASREGGPRVHLLDIGNLLNDILTGKTPLVIGERPVSRKWVRGSSFSLDGVHPGYTGQALVANLVLEKIDRLLQVEAPLYDLEAILSQDVYVDKDGDGWASGPTYAASGITELLFLFRDPDDSDPAVQVELPSDVWEILSRILMEEILGIPGMRHAARKAGLPTSPGAPRDSL